MRAARWACVVARGPGTRTWDDLGRPLGVGHHLLGQRAAGLGQRRRRARPGVGGPRGPLASTSTVSLVDVHPSTVIALNDAPTAPRERRVQRGRVDGGVGREHGQHRRHVRRQHGRPLGHAPDREPVARDDDLLGHGVGGHDGPGRAGAGLGVRAAAAGHDRRQVRLDRGRWGTGSRSGRSGTPGSRSAAAPIPPATGPHSRSAASRPGRAGGRVGVARREDRPRPPGRRWPRRWARLTCTGAAAARLAVNTPAAGTARPSVGGHHGHVGHAAGLDPGRAPRRPRTPAAR